jgi:hypothetical protein
MMKKSREKLSAAGKLTLAALFAMLVAAVAYAVQVWTSIDAQMTGWGWGMLVLGVVASVAVGGGLSVLLLYSARHDMDR